ncbi:MAG: sigma-70 family RNA polymerase sigma factor [Kiritimatiellia bacterium]
MPSGRNTYDRKQKLEAFEKVVSEYEGRLLKYGTSILRDPYAAQDVVQEAFIRLFKYWEEKLEPSPALSSWLYRVVHNCAVDYVRHESRRQARIKILSGRHPGAAQPDLGENLDVSDAAVRADRALRKLNMRERQLVVLKVYEEKSYREISEITGLTVGNVGYILHYAMKKLAAELKKDKNP